MIKNKPLYNIRIFGQQYFFDVKQPESVYFYTLHKCASSLFSIYVLKNIGGLEHVDYALDIYNGHIAINKKLNFKKKGYIYGPIRISADPRTPEYKMLTIPASQPEFIRDKIAIFLVRDPRDILVSSYYSFAYSHGFSSVKEIRNIQESGQKIIQNTLLDEYVVSFAYQQIKNFEIIKKLSNSCNRSLILKYEDMINNFDCFIAQLCEYVSIEKNVVQEIYQRSRPKLNEDILSHKRSGKVGGFRDKLKKDTIKSINSKLEETLSMFGYEQ